MPGNVAYGPLFLIAHKDNIYHGLGISISVGLLLLVVDHYRSLLILILFSPRFKRFHAIEYTVLMFHLFSVEGIVYTLVLRRLL